MNLRTIFSAGICRNQKKRLNLQRIQLKTIKEEKKMKAQFNLDMLYVSPFKWKRGFDEQTLTLKMVPMEQKRLRTGVAVLDAVVDRLMAGQDPATAAVEAGMTRHELSRTIYGLTGMNIQQLRTRWRARQVEELLRYTNLPLKEIMAMVRCTSQATFSRMVGKRLGMTPTRYRRMCREAGDVGKYGI